MKKKYLISIICIFLALLFVPGALSLAKGQSDFSVKENRALTLRPSLTFSDLMEGYFQEDYQNYLNDQFFMRDKWVTAKTTAMRVLGKKDINGVYIGNDGYLLEKYLPSDFDADTVNNNVGLLTDFLNDIAYDYDSVSCVIVPSKAAVLDNRMPKNAIAYNTDYVSQSIESSLDEEVNFLYLKDELVAHNDEYIYYKSDHHWTTLGAYYGYAAYKNLLGEKTPGLSKYTATEVAKNFLGTDYDKLQTNSAADTITRYDLDNQAEVYVDYNGEEDDSESLYVDSALKEKDKYTYFLGGNFPLINITTNVDNDRKLLLIKDSFSNSLLPFLVNDYSEIVVVDLRYFDDSIYTVLDEEFDITDVLVMYNTEKFMKDTNQGYLEYFEEDEYDDEEIGDDEEELGEDEEELGEDEEELGEDEEELGEYEEEFGDDEEELGEDEEEFGEDEEELGEA